MATEKRLIDANKIYDAVERRYKVSSGIEHRCERDFLDLICSVETEDAVEVVHGRWGAFEVFPGAASLNGYPCSVCGNRVPATLYNLNYCPNCGAKMDGDGNG